jgi:hypothetical protein
MLALFVSLLLCISSADLCLVLMLLDFYYREHSLQHPYQSSLPFWDYVGDTSKTLFWVASAAHAVQL